MPAATYLNFNYLKSDGRFESCHPDHNSYCISVSYENTGNNMPDMPNSVTSGIVNTPGMKDLVIAKKPHLYDAGGDVSKQWYVSYYCVHPVTDALTREKYSKGFTVLKTAAGRYAHAEKVVQYIAQCLKNGIHPYYQDKILPSKNQERNILTGTNKIEKVMRDSVQFVSESNNHKTLTNYQRYISYFLEWLNTKSINNQNLGTIDDEGANRFLNWLITDKKMSNKSRNEHLVFLRALFTYLKQKKRCLVNPFEFCKTKKHIAKYRQHYRENLRIRIISHLRNHDPLLLIFVEMVFYSMRRNGELMQLLISDINLIESRIIIRPEISKTDKVGFVEISNDLYESLQALNLHQYPGQYYLFGRGGTPGPEPMGKNNMYKRWRKVRTALNLPQELGIYNWKHTSVINANNAGIPLMDIKAQGGWTSIAMLDTYMQDLDTHQSEAIRNHMPAIDSRKHIKNI